MVCEQQEYAVRGLGTHEGHRETRLMLFPRDDADHPLARSFKRFLHDPEFPCVGAKSALSRDQIKIVVARDLTSGWDDLRNYPALLAFVSWYKRAPSLFRSFALIFETPPQSCPRRTSSAISGRGCSRSPTRIRGWDCPMMSGSGL